MSDIKTEEQAAVLADAGVPDEIAQLALGRINGTSNLREMLQSAGIESKEVAILEESAVTEDEVTEEEVAAEVQSAEEVQEAKTEEVSEETTEVEIPVEVSEMADAQKNALQGMVAGEFKNLNTYLKAQASVIDSLTARLSEIEKDSDTKVQAKMAEQYKMEKPVWSRPTEEEKNVAEEGEKFIAPTDDSKGHGKDEVETFFAPHFQTS